MKIVHLAMAHRPYDVRICMKEAVSLQKNGHSVWVVTSDRYGVENETIYKNVHIQTLPWVGKSRFLRTIKYLINAYKFIVSHNPDVVHIHEPILAFLVPLFKAKGMQLIYDSHEDMPREAGSNHCTRNRVINHYFIRLLEKVENTLVKKVDAVIGATPFITERFKNLNIFAINVNNYPMIEEMPDYTPNQCKVSKQICYVGTISEDRGLIQMIDALQYIDVRLALVGDISDSLLKKVENRPGWNKVDRYGYVGRSEIYEIYKSSLVGMVTLLPLQHYMESLPIKLFEYMMAGLPTISSNFPLWREIVEKNQCGMCIDPTNPNELADAIQYLIDHETESYEMGIRGREMVLSKFNWELEAEKLRSLYNTIGKKLTLGKD